MLNANAQINNTRLSKESEYIFRFTKTKLTNAEKNFFAKDYKLEYRKEEKDTVLTIEDINSKNHQRIRATVEVITVDINNDGKDEVFVRESDEYSSPDIQDLSLYIKNERGIYVRQEGVYSPEFFVRSTSNGGWPDLIGVQEVVLAWIITRHQNLMFTDGTEGNINYLKRISLTLNQISKLHNQQ